MDPVGTDNCGGCHALSAIVAPPGLLIDLTFNDSDGECQLVEGQGCVQLRPCNIKGTVTYQLTDPSKTFMVEFDKDYIIDAANPGLSIGFNKGDRNCGSSPYLLMTIKRLDAGGFIFCGSVEIRCGGCTN